MKELPRVHLTAPAEWREWLHRNHASSAGVWLVSYKQHTGRPRIAYDDAVEEALCFGWVDSLVKRIDDDLTAQKYTPRKAGSRWSPSNVRRFTKLVREGRMTPAGLVHEPTSATRDKSIDNKAAGVRVPASIAREFRKSSRAWANFQALTAAQRGLYVRWIDSAKKQDTRDRRVSEAIARLERNEKLGLK